MAQSETAELCDQSTLTGGCHGSSTTLTNNFAGFPDSLARRPLSTILTPLAVREVRRALSQMLNAAVAIETE